MLKHLPPNVATAPARRPGTLDQIIADAQPQIAIQNALDLSGNDITQAAEMLGRNEKRTVSVDGETGDGRERTGTSKSRRETSRGALTT